MRVGCQRRDSTGAEDSRSCNFFVGDEDVVYLFLHFHGSGFYLLDFLLLLSLLLPILESNEGSSESVNRRIENNEGDQYSSSNTQRFNRS